MSAAFSDGEVGRLLDDLQKIPEVGGNTELNSRLKFARAHVNEPDRAQRRMEATVERETQRAVSMERARMQAREEVAAERARENRGPFTVHTRDTLSQLPQVAWHVTGFLPTDGLVFVFGDSGIGKSAVLLDLVASCAAGAKFVGHWDTRPTRFLYVLGEGVSGFRQRIHEAETQHSVELGADVLRLATDGVNLADPESVRELSEYIAAENIDVVILDTYSQLAGLADENDAALNAQALRAADRIRQARQGTSVLLVHHSGKDSDRGMRGSSVQRANVDYVWNLSTTKDDVTEGVPLSLSSFPSNGGKARHSAPETVSGFARVKGHIELIDAAPVWLDGIAVATKVTSADLYEVIGKSERQNKRDLKQAVDDGYLIKIDHGIYERPVWK